ncbi:MAG TPA: hypothetical protein VGQ47_04020 [Candidatus Limnocylindrales bacterium]|jgi:hypothetical protein|nr:hypothetical protein [Candidatus Limnocylindrales bacterium]
MIEHEFVWKDADTGMESDPLCARDERPLSEHPPFNGEEPPRKVHAGAVPGDDLPTPAPGDTLPEPEGG